MVNKEKDSGQYSPRNSLLIWVAGIVLGWGFAVVVVYQVIKGPDTVVTAEADVSSATQNAQNDEAQLQEIAPAAGKP